MNSFAKSVVCAVVLAGACAFAQQPAPESTNNNRNEPSVKVQPQGPPAGSSQAPSATAPQAPTGKETGHAIPDRQVSDVPRPAPPTQPQTILLPGAETQASADPVLEVPKLPKGDATLIGGTAVKVDRIRNRMVVQPFGGGKKMRINFDERSHLYRDGRETTVTGLKEGDRVYADTMLVDGKVFARNVRVQTQSGPAEARGQIMQLNSQTGTVVMLDQLTQQQVRFTVSDRTAIKARDGSATATDLKPGALIDVIFQPGHGKAGDAREVSLLATPGSQYVFVGKVTYLNLSTGIISVDNETDSKNYELRFDPAKVTQRDQLGVGSQITANATFEGSGYRAQSIAVTQPPTAQQ